MLNSIVVLKYFRKKGWASRKMSKNKALEGDPDKKDTTDKRNKKLSYH